MALAQSFHNTIDNANSFQAYNGAGSTQPPNTVTNRSVTYQFFSHFHSYVQSLIERLNDGGFPELQASDTLYVQPLTPIPDSTRASLLQNLTTIPLSAGTPLTLPHGTSVTVAAGTMVVQPDGSTSPLSADISFALPGFLPVSYSGGIQNISGPGAIIIPDGTAVTVTLPAGSSAVLTVDGTPVQLSSNTSVAIRSGLPQPVLYVDDFKPRYSPDTSVTQPYPVKNLDFAYNGAYSIYNWELFFHAPLLIAIHLSQNQKFQDSQNWFHYIFNPTDNSQGPTPQRFWQVQPFQSTDVEMIEQILVNLSTPQDPQLYAETVQSITAWMNNPFQPWAVAQYRPTAYMLKTVMAYLDNLIAWGDSLFQQYTIETINEATQLYIMAANILGDKPQAVPQKGSVKSLTYNDLRNAGLDPFGNAMVDMEVDIPFDITIPAGPGIAPSGGQILPSIGKTLYFCIPQNAQLLGYWDTVADRLFKIRNSLNLQGVFQQLPLYDPPIDPALLVRAAAAGLDVSAIVSGLNQPLPLVRFQLLISKATEICQEVKSLGANLLAAIEKQDNESLSLLRAQHEDNILQLVAAVKAFQSQDATKNREALEESLTSAVRRYAFYQQLLGLTNLAASLPGISMVQNSQGGITSATVQDETQTSNITPLPISVDISGDAPVDDGGIRTLSGHEVQDLNLLVGAEIFNAASSASNVIAAILAPVPKVDLKTQPFGVGLTIGSNGLQLAALFNSLAAGARGTSEVLSAEAAQTAKAGSYERRQQEWMNQSNVAMGDIKQLSKQIVAAQIRESIAQTEVKNHQVQMDNAQQILDFLQGNANDPTNTFNYVTKTSTVGFYAWMKREVKALYANAFQLAFEVAKKAERALQNELGDPSLTFIQYNYLDGTEGLLAGENLMFDIKTMEMAYHDLNQREYELTKHVSLLQVDPLALVQLRATGSCTFSIPEEMFDMDGPGHYFRRTKSLAITLPCVAGPYTSVNCTLSLQKSSIRISTDLGKTYARQGADDPRFNDYYGTLQSIVTSSAQTDSGLFETNLHDERYLPFEGTGVAGSQWQITLPSDVRQFDFDTITDVILHVRYTARDGGDLLKAAAVQNLQTLINKAQTVGSVCLFSVRHEFPSQWAKFQNVTINTTIPTAELQLTLVPELYPFWSQGIVDVNPSKAIKAIEFFAEMSQITSQTININNKSDKSGNNDVLTQNPTLGNLFSGELSKIPLPAAITGDGPPLTLYFDDNSMEDLWLAITWGKG